MKYTITNDSVTIVYKGEPHTVTKGQPNYVRLRAAALAGNWDDVPGLLTVASTLASWSRGDFQVREGQVFYQDEDIPETVSKRIIRAVSAGDDPDRYLRFWERLDRNPDRKSVLQLLTFLDHTGIPITPEGMILAYKGVTREFRDLHSGRFDNSVGSVLQMKRWRVSNDPDTPCHFGFHVGARTYASTFGARVVIVEVDPEHVVSVPKDAQHQKMRVCKYRVIGVDNGQTLPDFGHDDDPAADLSLDEGGDEADDGALATDGTPLEKGETRPMREGQEVKTRLPRTGTEWDYLNDMDSLALSQLRIMPLRAYARYNCLIVGASKMPGGKATLVPAIIEARGYNDPSDKPDHLK